MIHAYAECYLPDAMTNLAGAFDYAINDCGLTPQLFADFLAIAPAVAGFERGTPKYVCGMSGEELVMEIMRDSGWIGVVDMPVASMRVGATPEYWVGWSLAYCQWSRGVRFRDILDVMPIDDMLAMYPVLHETGEDRFVEIYDERAAAARDDGNSCLGVIRRRAGLSQADLADRAGVSLRSVQMYEQRRKDIRKASVTAVFAMARVLGCEIEDLLEPVA